MKDEGCPIELTGPQKQLATDLLRKKHEILKQQRQEKVIKSLQSILDQKALSINDPQEHDA